MPDSPVRSTFLPFSRPAMGDDEIAGVADVLRSGWITTGPKVQEFERRFAAYVGAQHALAVTSGTAGEHVTLLALGIGPGDEVITSPLTWASTANIVAAVGARPVFADVDPRTFNIDPAEVRAKLSPRTKAIIPVHFAGLPCDLDALHAIASEHGVPLIEDAAHAVGSFHGDRPIGGAGHTAIYSFHPIKNMTTGEGGMITTDDAELAARIRLWRFHGVNRDSWARAGKGGAAGYDILLPGFKYNMTDIQAVLGLVQLGRLDAFNARRTQLALRYLELLEGVRGLTLPAADAAYPTTHSWHLFTVLIDPDVAGLDRFEFMEALRRENIGTGLHFLAVHLAPWYERHLGCRRGDFPAAERISDRICSLPLFPDMTDADQDDVVRAIRKVLGARRAR